MSEYLALSGVVSLTKPGWTLSAAVQSTGQPRQQLLVGNLLLITRDQTVTPPRPQTLAARLTARV